MVKANLQNMSPRVKELEALVEKQSQQIADMRKARFSIPVGRKKASGKTYLRVIIPDTHGAHLDKLAARAFLNDLAILKPAEVVMLGDHIDCGGFLALHHTMGFVPECNYTFEQDVAAANTFLDAVGQAVGAKVPTWYIIGNHEARIEKWIINQTLRNPRDAAFLYKMFGPENVLGLEQRGIEVVRRDEQYSGLRKRGTIKLGKCMFQHGTRYGDYAAKRALDDVGGNICFGHTHRIAAHVREWAGGTIGAWSFGCLCELAPTYGDTQVCHWSHGYGIQVVGKDGSFMTMQVPIIGGQSYLNHVLGSR